jgi:Domain of unknown function (DUF4419)
MKKYALFVLILLFCTSILGQNKPPIVTTKNKPPIVAAKNNPPVVATKNTPKAVVPTSQVIKICNIKRADKLLAETPYKDIVQKKFITTYLAESAYNRSEGDLEKSKKVAVPKRRIESFSRTRLPMVVSQNNGFFDAAYYAFSDHRPLIISPDMIWLVISQGFATHVNENSEKLRHHFVTFEGKKVLNVQRDNFVLGNEKNDWEGVFSEFKGQIAGYTGKEVTNLISKGFSTTTPDAQVAFDITLMDAMKNYFDYSMSILCGIPEIRLEGTVEDWQAIEKRAAQLGQYDLEWWTKDLKPILAEFTQAAKGKPNIEFWDSMVKIHRQTVGCASESYITGWVAKLYPYLKDHKRNPLIGENNLDKYFTSKTQNWGNGKKAIKTYSGPKVEPKDLTSGISNAELLVDNNGSYHKMELKAGFFGIQQSPKDFALRPVIGWAVIETDEQPDTEVVERYKKFIKTRNNQKPVVADPPKKKNK